MVNESNSGADTSTNERPEELDAMRKEQEQRRLSPKYDRRALKLTPEEIERAAEQVFPAAVPTGVAFKKRVTGSFPALLMQRGHLSDIVVNLLLNARQAAGEQGAVELTAACSRDQIVEIVVQDNGPGIDEEVRNKLFHENITTKVDGHGYGLPVCRQIIELHGGTIRLETRKNGGAKFIMTFPGRRAPATEAGFS